MKGDLYSGYVFWDKDISFSKNEKELLAENIKRILTTKRGERVNEPNFGSNISTFLFMPQMYVSDLLDEIKYSIETNEPRVSVKSCTLETNMLQEDVVIVKLALTYGDSEIQNIEVEI